MGQNCKPQPGDLIEIDRHVYKHWALYVGNGYVIHVTDQGDSSSSGSIKSLSTSRAKVNKELLTTVAGNDNWRVNNKYDQYSNPFPVEEIIRRAEQWIDTEVPYDLLSNNCEHFVTRLHYGAAVSDQVENAFIGGAAATIGSIAAGAVVLVGLALSKT